jgi:S-DNA-T family DNA segregation ATPase FtsK/SpoIIIE
MPVEPSSPPDTAHGVALDAVVGRIALLKREYARATTEREAAEIRYDDAVTEADSAKRDARAALESGLKRTLETESTRYEQRQEIRAQRIQRHQAMIDRGYSTCRAQILERLRTELDAHQAELDSVKRRLAEVQEQQAVPAEKRQALFMDDNAASKKKAEELRESLQSLAEILNIELRPLDGIRTPDLPDDDALETVAGEVSDAIDTACEAVEELPRSNWSRAARDSYVGAAYFLAVFFHVGLLGLLLHLGTGMYGGVGALIALTGTGAGIHLLSAAAKRRSLHAIQRLHVASLTAAVHVEFLAREGMERLDPNRFLDERIDKAIEFERLADAVRAEKKAKSQAAQADLDARRAAAREKATLGSRALAGRDGPLWPEREDRIRREFAQKLADSDAVFDGIGAARERDAAIARCEHEWADTLASFLAFVDDARAACTTRHPPWSDGVWEHPRAAEDFPSEVPIGSARFDLNAIASDPAAWPSLGTRRSVDVPVALSFPACGSLFVRCRSGNRTEALSFVHDAVLRTLSALPPNKAKLTMVDPVALGESFSGLMRLADHDEAIVDRRIWTEGSHIERRLEGLTQHVEKVIQKYLRNQYSTIDEFNSQAGEMKEAYRFLVIADFPTGFSELGLERLASIIASGPRCGVFTFILCDAKQPLPSHVDMHLIKRNGLVLREDGEEFVAEHAEVKIGPFTGEAPPDAERVTQLLDRIGAWAVDAERVEVPFISTSPGAAGMWSASTDAGIRIPIGKSGADKLRWLDLGKGTAQHALIGGRTGSGKSNLFHVITTSGAQWYGPDELECYLIDFKKGVEFKAFANGKLPHARVIAIESDREFGVSVLQRIDRELSARGVAFRKAGVQDLAAYRRAEAQPRFPRTLLIIDEFQEFFTEDDAVARDAALLLDRFVRQGRAFGIHVVLGSQTLSGIYSLAKSTLGQIGVRIALQCNEADSHLIFGEDNAAARLLSRPGEAIYNDMSGLVEGNDPFQVVWLPDTEEADVLRTVAAHAERTGWKPERPTVVFEGNAPADIANNPELADVLAQPYAPADANGVLWLGEANSIKGPTEVAFVRGGGSNLLVVGQNREAALATVCAASIGLAARSEPGAFKTIVFNGGGDETEEHLQRLSRAMPHEFDVVEPRRIPEVVEALETMAANTDETPGKHPRMCVIVFGAQRLKILRQDENRLFSMDADEGVPASARFATVLSEGPERGIHTIVWCDSLGNLNRTFSRKTMREFDMRVLFQMSASDSSELIDATAANNLGLHGALLSVESDGSMEKFRPYMIPDEGFIESLRERMAKRFS